MTNNTLRLYAPNETVPSYTLNNTHTLALTVDTNGEAWYTGTSTVKVALILADLEENRMELTLTPQSGVSALRVDDIDGTPYPHTSGAPVSSGASWTSTTGNGLAFVFITPPVQHDQFDWKIGEAVPPVRLTVKIKRP